MIFPDFSLTFPVCSKFPDFSLTGKCLPIFPGFPGFPVRVGTLSICLIKECRSIVRDESSVYFNVTAKHVWHLVATVYKPTVPCMITIELSDIWLISEAIYHLIFTQDPLNWSLESPPQHRDDFVMPTFLYRVKKQPKMLTLVKICICAT